MINNFRVCCFMGLHVMYSEFLLQPVVATVLVSLYICDMQVTFVGEGAMDHGEPRRVFFFRLFGNGASQAYFRGASEKCRFFDNNVVAVTKCKNKILCI